MTLPQAVRLGEWHVVFLANGYTSFTHRIFCPGPFTHLYLATRIGGVWIVLDPGFIELQTTVYFPAAFAARLEAERARGRHVVVRVDSTLYPRRVPVRFRSPPTCVSFALHVLGFAAFVLTPSQLHRRLLACPAARAIEFEELFPADGRHAAEQRPMVQGAGRPG